MKILQKYTDIDHKINCCEIIEKLKEYGFSCERKSIYSDIKALSEYGYDINKDLNKKEGFYLDTRNFQEAEIKLLLDAIAAAPFITVKKTAELEQKLLADMSVYKSDLFKSTVGFDERIKNKNEEILYNIDIINQAINSKKKIYFTYYHKIIKNNKIVFDNGKRFFVSPYGLFWSQDKYYLIANYQKYDNLSNYRVDRIKKAEISSENVRDISEVSEYKNNINISDYILKNPEIFSGNPQNVTIKIPTELLEIFAEKFDEKNIHPCDEANRFLLRSKISITDGFVNWLLPYCDRIKIIGPAQLKKTIKEKINLIYNNIN